MMRRSFALCLTVCLTGCMVGPDYHKPAAIVPAHYKEAPGWTKAQPADALIKGAWWQVYHDPILDRLEPMVAVSNQTLAADYAAYEQASAIIQEARGGLFPSVGLTASATRAGNGGGGSSASVGGGGAAASGPHTSGSFEGSVSWAPDIWGKIRRQVQSDVAAAQISAADLANATLSDQALLASDYIDLRGSDAQIKLLQRTVTAYQKSLQITEDQSNAGTITPLAVITARTQLDGARAQLVSAGEARAQYEHAIAVLVGHAPVDLSIPAGDLMQNVPEVPVGLPSTLLQRRPDIAAAERAMAQANAQIGVAVGAYYPDLSLSALGGYSADPIAGLFSVSNALWSLGASATGTLFEGGTRAAGVSAAEFAYQQSIALYRQTVLTAFQQIEDQLSALRILAQQAQIEQAAVGDASRALQIALNEYQAGTVDYTTVVSAQVTLLADQQTALSVQQNRLLASVSLIEALGGGWRSTDLPSSGALQPGAPFLP